MSATATLWVVEWKLKRNRKWMAILSELYLTQTKANEECEKCCSIDGDYCDHRVAKYIRAQEG